MDERERVTKSPISIQTVVGTWNQSTLTFFACSFLTLFLFHLLFSSSFFFIAWYLFIFENYEVVFRFKIIDSYIYVWLKMTTYWLYILVAKTSIYHTDQIFTHKIIF